MPASALSGSDSESSSVQCARGEIGLFVIWEAAGQYRDEIIDDLSRQFEILRVCRITWNRANVLRNFERFYSDLDVRGVYHVFNKGAGPLTAVVVRDRLPRTEKRLTARGERTVNARFLEAKLRFRESINGLAVHCGETAWETHRDTTMLFGAGSIDALAANATRWDGAVDSIRQDPAGANGWPCVGDMLQVVNRTVRYVVLHGEARAAEAWLGAGSGAIELLTDDYHALHTSLNARPGYRCAPSGGRFHVSVGTNRLAVTLRFAGDGFYDSRWAAAVLARRVLNASGYFVPHEADAVDLLSYHVLVHAPRRAEHYVEKLRAMGASQPACLFSDAKSSSAVAAKSWLDKRLSALGYSMSRPLDPAVFFDPDCRGRNEKTRIVRQFVGKSTVLVLRLRGDMQSFYLAVRDRVLLRASWLRGLKRMLQGKPPDQVRQ